MICRTDRVVREWFGSRFARPPAPGPCSGAEPGRDRDIAGCDRLACCAVDLSQLVPVATVLDFQPGPAQNAADFRRVVAEGGQHEHARVEDATVKGLGAGGLVSFRQGIAGVGTAAGQTRRGDEAAIGRSVGYTVTVCVVGGAIRDPVNRTWQLRFSGGQNPRFCRPVRSQPSGPVEG